MLFLSCKANARVKLAKSGHGPHLYRIIVFCVVLVIVLCYHLYAVLLYCYCVAMLLFVLSYVLIVCTVSLPAGVNPIAVDKYIISYQLSHRPSYTFLPYVLQTLYLSSKVQVPCF